MWGAAHTLERNYGWRMIDVPPPRLAPEVKKQVEALAETVRFLRSRAGDKGRKLAAEVAAARAGVKRQTWDSWEKGAEVLLRADYQGRIIEALQVTPETFQTEYLRRLGLPTAAQPARDPDRARAREGDLLNDLPRLVMPDDLLRPWAHSGQLIVYDPRAWPREGHGCVLQRGEERIVKIFVMADAQVFHLKELNPDRSFTVPRGEFSAFAVVGRIG